MNQRNSFGYPVGHNLLIRVSNTFSLPDFVLIIIMGEGFGEACCGLWRY